MFHASFILRTFRRRGDTEKVNGWLCLCDVWTWQT